MTFHSQGPLEETQRADEDGATFERGRLWQGRKWPDLREEKENHCGIRGPASAAATITSLDFPSCCAQSLYTESATFYSQALKRSELTKLPSKGCFKDSYKQ